MPQSLTQVYLHIIFSTKKRYPFIEEAVEPELFAYIGDTIKRVGGMPFFDSLCHTFGTMATGGFSTQSASIGAYGPYMQRIPVNAVNYKSAMSFIDVAAGATPSVDKLVKSVIVPWSA